MEPCHHRQADPGQCVSGGAPRPRLALVTQRCGIEVNGGAETMCREVAKRMAAYWDLEVLTTCALVHDTWANHYPAGLAEVEGVAVRRFPVERERDLARFNQCSAQLVAAGPAATLAQQEEWMRLQGPWSPALFQHIRQNVGGFDAYIFFGYLYAQTYFGLPAVAQLSFLQPFAHDEWTIKFPFWDQLFQAAGGIIYSTPAERAFLHQRFPGLDPDGPVIGMGIEPPSGISPEDFRAATGIRQPFMLYAGRIEPAKGCDELFAHFMAYKQAAPGDMKLVLVGRSQMEIPAHPDILPLGFVDDATKWNAFAAADLVVVPSRYESLSIALLEGWAMGKPAVVNGECAVLVDQCRRGQGGLWYRNGEQFTRAIGLLAGETGRIVGQQGREFVAGTYDWQVVARQYADCVATRMGLGAAAAGQP